MTSRRTEGTGRAPFAVAATAGVALFAAAAGTVVAQDEREIWDGVYTAAQAERGKPAYVTSCGRCHNNELLGSERAPALKGDAFWKSWENDTLDKLYTKIRDTMPAGGIETVTDATKLDILAFMLAANDVPAGPVELSLEPESLGAIAVTRKGAATSGVASNFALVRTVGCLTRGEDRRWMLSHAAEPIVAREETPDAAALSDAARQPLGDLRFRLLSVVAAYDPDALAGRKVEARGLVFRRQGDDRLNLTSLRVAASGCEPR